MTGVPVKKNVLWLLFNQKKVMKMIDESPTKCGCGYPFPLAPRTIMEGVGRVPYEYTHTCTWCGKVSTYIA